MKLPTKQQFDEFMGMVLPWGGPILIIMLMVGSIMLLVEGCNESIRESKVERAKRSQEQIELLETKIPLWFPDKEVSTMDFRNPGHEFWSVQIVFKDGTKVLLDCEKDFCEF